MLADGHGNVIHLGERDCSIQRRHQKLIEEAPAPHVDDEMRERIGKIATDAAQAVDYRGAGTIEGMQVGDDYFFLEMNTRVQVEHCVTEMVTGIDIVREQIRIAAGEPLSITQDEMSHARPRDRVPDQRRGRAQEVRSRPGQGRRLRRALGPGRPGRLGPRGRRRGDPALRPDGREADHLGRRPREGHRADAPRPRRVRDRGPDDADPLPRDDPRDRAVGARARPAATCSRTRTGSRACPPGDGARADRRRRRGADRAGVQGRGRRPALSGQGDRRGARRRSGSTGNAAKRPPKRERKAGGGGGIRRRRSSRRCRAASSRSRSPRATRSRRARCSSSSRR